jgi:hypothetical protein
VLDQQQRKQPRRVISGFKIFHEYNPSHRYGSGHDIGGGVGLDSSTSVFIDYGTFPNKVAVQQPGARRETLCSSPYSRPSSPRSTTTGSLSSSRATMRATPTPLRKA